MAKTRRYDLQNALGYQITLLARINERLFEKRLCGLGLTRQMWCVLLAVEEEGLSNPSDIARFIGINRTAASRTLRRMESLGLIRRQGADCDRRKTMVLITPQGKDTMLTSIPQAQFAAERLKSKLTQAEQTQLCDLIAKLLQGEDRDISNL
jgi:MarR family transcriptional regulator, transcriptional regulator for hemolysin